MMKIRAWIEHLQEFYYPKNDTPAAYAEFWSVLEGYRRKDKEFELSYSTSIHDRDDNEVYTSDLVTIYLLEGGEDPSEAITTEEVGVVDFMDGCFVVLNDDGLIMDLADLFAEDGTFAINIIGSIYEQTV